MSEVIYWHPGAPWGVCLKSLYYCSGSPLVVVHMHLLRVWNRPCVFDILRYSPKRNFGRDFVVIHTCQQVLGRKDWYIGRVNILRISQCVELHDQDVFTNQSKWIVPVQWRSLVYGSETRTRIIHDVYRYTNVLQNNWAAFNKHHASTEVDLTYVDSSVKPWWMPQWRRSSGLWIRRYLGLIPGIPSTRVALWWQGD